jgi:hypothetical protein
MDGAGLVSVNDIGSTTPAVWHIQGTSDRNGDGSDDIVWKSSNDGGVVEWRMSGGFLVRIDEVGVTPLPSQIVGSHYEIV